jgi:hypothetical protein
MAHHAVAYPTFSLSEMDLAIKIECPTHGIVHETKSANLATVAVRKHEKDYHPRSYQKLYA